MSIEIHAFLGLNTANIQERFLQEFARAGFGVAIHPSMSLLESNRSGCLYLSFLHTPPHVRRAHPGVPLLVGFGYEVARRSSGDRPADRWPPRNVKRYSYEIRTRTSSGRSAAAFYAQAFTAAILAKVTDGQFFLTDEGEAISGRAALQRFGSELAADDGMEFDYGIHPFEDWPPVDPAQPFVWPQLLTSELVMAPSTALRPPSRTMGKIVEEMFCVAVLVYFLATLIQCLFEG